MLRLVKFAATVQGGFLKNGTRCFVTKTALKDVPQAQPEKQLKFSESFVMNTFVGKVHTSQVFPYPEPMTEEQTETIRMLIDPMEKFYEEINDPMRNDEAASIDEKTTKALWELGAFGLQVPQEYGGLGLTNTQYSRCVEICGYHDLGIGITLGAHQSIGFKGILLFGTPEQKQKYLPRVTNGEYAAFCLTEPTSGSDANSIRCKAVKSTDGSHYILNGSKIWISNGGIADIMTVFAQVPTTDPKTGETKNRMTAFIVERSFGGVSSGPPEKKMGIKCSNTAEIFFEDCKVPAENVLSEEGQGFKVAMNILNNGRFGMSAALSGTMRFCIKKAVDHAINRVQFGKTIDNYGTIQEKLARMGMLHYVTESLSYMISGLMDKGSQDYHLEAAISKCFASESAWWVCDEAIQVLGGMGYMREAGLERVLRDLRIFRIFEGTNDILRLFVALTGIQYAGMHLRQLQKAIKNPTANFGLIMGTAAKRACRALGFPSVNIAGMDAVDPTLHNVLMNSVKCCIQFGLAVEALLVRDGRAIADDQFVLNRITQAVFDIYTSMVVISRASMSASKGLPSAQHELNMAQLWCTEATNRVLQNINVFASNRRSDIPKRITSISRKMCDAGGVVQLNPLGF